MSEYERKQLLYKFILAVVFIGCVTTVVTYYEASINMSDDQRMETEELSEDSEENIDKVSKDLKNFREIIDAYYIGDIDEQKMVDEAIKGYVKGLDDEYSEYMTAEEWEEYQVNTLGNYVGIGIYMNQDEDGEVVVVEPIEDSPAKEVGLKQGDIIKEVDGEDITGQDIDIVSSKIKGEEGTKVNIKILRDGQTMNFNIERKAIKIYRVTSQMLENNIGYIDLSTFDENCSEEFKSAYEELEKNGAKKLIIDLRDNTGGLVDEALEIADMIVPKGKKLLVTVDSKDKKEVTMSEEEPIVDMDIVVLVNEYSASASEILVGCLKDNKEAAVVGQKTYGKGVIQNVFSMFDGSVLKLTTAEYFTPNETKINKKGIEPDFVVENIPDEGEVAIDEQLEKAKEVINQ